MRDRKETEQIVYRKLVRDKVPEIIKKEGKKAFVEKAKGGVFDCALGRKILEEAGELFSEWTGGDAAGILKESADMLEVLLAVLKRYGLSFADLNAERERRACQRGRFEKKLLLESIGHPPNPDLFFFETPGMFFSSDGGSQLIDLISSELARSRSAWIASAFYSPGITNLLVPSFEKFIKAGGDLNILLSTMGNIVRPEYLTHLQQSVPGAKLKVFHPPDLPYDKNPPNFHVKTYLFLHRCGTGAMLIGSSNFSQAGFCGNIEWNYFSQGEINLPFDKASPFASAQEEFKKYWLYQSTAVTDDFIRGYRIRRGTMPIIESQAGWTLTAVGKGELFEKQTGWIIPEIKPNPAQIEALDNLAAMREQGVKKAAIVAATGVGKTYLAVFDFKASGANRVLYIAHRETILGHAMESFRRVLGDKRFGALLGRGQLPPERAPGVFAMVQTLSKKEQLKKFLPDAFDYIVMDEFHHSEATSYRQVLNYFKPDFFLGLTATPERMDGRDVLRNCDYNIAYEVRILEAVDKGWLAPFQYFAIYDETDYNQILWRGTHYDEAELDKALINDTRTAVVAKNLLKFLPAHGKIKALAFCSSQAHAKYTARRLIRDHDIEAVDLTNISSDVDRKSALDRLQDENDPLRVICCVDIFNEGVDVPDLTHVLFIRPTQSFTVFLQQLGRGLRKTPGKDFLVAIDFVGNFRKAHVAPLALAGYTSVQEYIEEYLLSKQDRPWAQLPKGCYVSKDLSVQRIWDEEIRSIIRDRTSPEDRLKILYLEIRENLSGQPPSLMDFFANAYIVDPYVFIRHFGNWLRAREHCGADLTPYERSLLGTPGEAFLQHLEKELNPVKSYKMVVLNILLEQTETSWAVSDIAEGFLHFYLHHRDKMFDYDELYKSKSPQTFPLKKVMAKLKQMPLKYLSNTESDYFILDKNNGRFFLKDSIRPFWQQDAFRSLVADRVAFALARYFKNRSKRETV